MPDGRSLVIPTAVYLGAVVLVAVPATWLFTAVIGVTLEFVGLEGFQEPLGGSLIVVVSFLVGLQLAVEAAAVALGGVDALERGSPRTTLARYVLFTVSAFVALVAVTWAGFSAAFGGHGTETLALGLFVASAGLFVLYRSANAFLAGVRSDV